MPKNTNKKYLFKLRSDRKPHLYVYEINNIIEKDGYLHPTLERLLKLLRKTHAVSVPLAFLKEVYISEKEYLIIDRNLSPTLSGFTKTEMTEDQQKQIDDGRREFYNEMFQLYKSLGYELAEESEVPDEIIEDIILLTNKKPKKKIWGK